MNDKIEFIRERCIEANPEIVEIKFGCQGTYVEPWRGNTVHCTVIGNYPATGIRVDLPHANHTAMIGQKALTVIGRPIRLADVIHAVDQISMKRQRAICMQICEAWEMTKDDLTEQPPETVEFIYNLFREWH